MISHFGQRRTYLLPALAIPFLSLMPLFLLARHKPGEQEGPVAQLGKAPSSVQSLKNPYEGQAEAIAAGRKLYRQHCAECHGPDGRGLEHAANLHSPAVQDAPPGVVFWALRNGRIRKGVPSWSRLPDEQIWQLVTFLQTLK